MTNSLPDKLQYAIDFMVKFYPELKDPEVAYGKCETMSLKFKNIFDGECDIVYDGSYNGFGYGHFWIKCDDLFIDFTARQFGAEHDFPKIWTVSEGTGRISDVYIGGVICPRTCSKVIYNPEEGVLKKFVKI